MVNMDSNETKDKVLKLEQKMAKIDDNVNLLTHIFEEILKEFEKIKKDVAEQQKKQNTNS